MKAITCVLVALAMLSSTAAADEPAGRTVEVSGEAKSTVVPDQIQWKLVIIVRNEVQQELSERAGAVMSQIKSIVDRLGREKDSVEYGKVSIRMRFVRENNSETEDFSHYELDQPITVTQTDIGSYERY